MASPDTFTAEVPKELEEDPEYSDWEDHADGSILVKVQAARDKIVSEGIITSVKDLSNGLYEKKWNSGLRLYFAVIEHDGKKTLLLLGSGKGNKQEKAIEKSRRLLDKYKVLKGNISKKD